MPLTSRDEEVIIELYRKYVNTDYINYLIKLDLAHIIVEASGSVITDSRGKTYIDFIAGYGIYNLGHNPSDLINVLCQELQSSTYWSRPFLNQPLADLSSKLVSLTNGNLSRVFICSTGAEAIDSALKLARLSTKRTEIIATTQSFHGFTLGALSVCGIPGLRKLFEPLIPRVRFVPYGELDSLTNIISNSTAAVLLEPVQAEIGAITPKSGYLNGVRELCDRYGALLILDEVRTGMGRTGQLFAFEKENIIPDILVVGKSMGGGIVPIGAIMARNKTWGRFGLSFSMSASSFAGNRLACAAALAALDIVEKKDILNNAKIVASIIRTRVDALQSMYPTLIEKITGTGLLIGIHFKNIKLANDVIRYSIQNGLLIAAAFCNTRCILLEPPLVIESKTVIKGLQILENACKKVSMSVGVH